MARTLSGRLRNREGRPYAGFVARATFGLARGGVAQASAVVAEDGAFELPLPDAKELAGRVQVAALGPDGKAAAAADVATDEERVELEVTPAEPIAAPLKPAPARHRLVGRVVGEGAPTAAAHRRVVLVGRVDERPQVLFTATTDRTGYFAGSYPLVEVEEAWAVVSGALEREIPLRTGPFAGLRSGLPPRVVLTARFAASPDPSCACDAPVPRSPEPEDVEASPEAYTVDLGGGRCVDLTTPNRTLEEFDFYGLVRTSDPLVRGVTATPPAPVPQDLLDRLEELFPSLGRLFGSVRRDASAARLPLSATAVRDLLRDGETLPLERIERLVRAEAARDVLAEIDRRRGQAPGRAAVDPQHAIDWDAEPTRYEATTVAHAHVLHFKQRWWADGYSLGDLLYSVPLAPCQSKQIAILDWERRETARRDETGEQAERLDALLAHDRDVSELVETALTEHLRGSSKATTAGLALGGGAGGTAKKRNLGFAVASFGGLGTASSTATQEAARELTASSLQQLHDRLQQAASSIRSQRSTVVTTVAQGETVRAETDVVANHNHCHALTIQYFEVLRHFRVTTDLVEVREALLVPLSMRPFSAAKVARWRDLLLPALLDRSLAGGFDAIERIETDYADADVPARTFAEEPLEHLQGALTVRFRLPRPRDAADGAFDASAWAFLGPMLALDAAEFHARFLALTAERDRVFQQELAPKLAARFAESLVFELEDPQGGVRAVPLRASLSDAYAPDRPIAVRVFATSRIDGPARERVAGIRVRAQLPTNGPSLPAGSQVIVDRARFRYRTRHLDTVLADAPLGADLAAAVTARVDAPLSLEERRDPRREDARLARRLIAHLNAEIEYYHKAIWAGMDADRRFLLLDGFLAPGGGGRSLASVVENRVLGVVGNSLVFPVAAGTHLDPRYTPEVLTQYRPDTPPPPLRIAVPTRGVFAEAVMGACNACERIEDDRFWRFEESPCPGSPTPIQPLDLGSRRAEPNVAPTAPPPPVVTIQNAPAAPDPTGLAAALQTIGNGNLFRDVTGLAGNQQNAALALQTSADAAKFLAAEASRLASQQLQLQRGGIEKSIRSIQAARDAGLIDEPTAQELSASPLRSMVGAPATPRATAPPAAPSIADPAIVQEVFATQARSDEGTFELATAEGTLKASFKGQQPAILAVPILPQPTVVARGFAAIARHPLGYVLLLGPRDGRLVVIDVDPLVTSGTTGVSLDRSDHHTIWPGFTNPHPPYTALATTSSFQSISTMPEVILVAAGGTSGPSAIHCLVPDRRIAPPDPPSSPGPGGSGGGLTLNQPVTFDTRTLPPLRDGWNVASKRGEALPLFATPPDPSRLETPTGIWVAGAASTQEASVDPETAGKGVFTIFPTVLQFMVVGKGAKIAEVTATFDPTRPDPPDFAVEVRNDLGGGALSSLASDFSGRRSVLFTADATAGRIRVAEPKEGDAPGAVTDLVDADGGDVKFERPVAVVSDMFEFPDVLFVLEEGGRVSRVALTGSGPPRVKLVQHAPDRPKAPDVSSLCFVSGGQAIGMALIRVRQRMHLAVLAEDGVFVTPPL